MSWKLLIGKTDFRSQNFQAAHSFPYFVFLYFFDFSDFKVTKIYCHGHVVQFLQYFVASEGSRTMLYSTSMLA